MRKVFVLSLLILISIIESGWTSLTDKVSYRCLIQLTNYGGEGAYVITSLIKPEGDYEKTLYVGGDDAEWYPDLPGWYEFYDSEGEDIDGITGASIQSGGRKVILMEVDRIKLRAAQGLGFDS